MLKRIAVFTSNRSEYGLLLPVLKKLSADPRFFLDLLVGGSHLLTDYGYTIDRIKEDGFSISEEFPFLAERPTASPEAGAMAELTRMIGNYFAKEKPDLLVILGDRFELLPVASVALVMNIPIAHISGGDVTEGAIDNQIRHALTKMAHIHFPATEAYKRNLMRMGEEEWRICVSGEPGLDEILSMDFMPKTDLHAELSIPIHSDVILITFHPETIENAIDPKFIEATAEKLLAATDYHLLFTAANFDPGGAEINACLKALARNPRISYVASLGQKRYYAVLKSAVLMIGNSSSGLTEAQSFGLPALNVGKRQQGRMANANVIHVAADSDDILEAIPHALSPAFRSEFAHQANIYGDGKAADRILAYLGAVNPQRLLLKKTVLPS